MKNAYIFVFYRAKSPLNSSPFFPFRALLFKLPASYIVHKVQYSAMKAHISVSSVDEHVDQRFATFVRNAIFSLERARKESQPQKRVAAELGMSFRTLQEWLGGRTIPSSAIAVLDLICLVEDERERLRLLDIWTDKPATTNLPLTTNHE
jgi:DNA-binding transcriptional regulator YiaG